MKRLIFPAIFLAILFTFTLMPVVAQQEDGQTPTPETVDVSDQVDEVEESVKQKVEEALNKPKAYLGTVTDKTEDTLQIKTEKEEILQISVNQEQTTFAKINKKTESVEFSDVAIGDFVISMGYTNGNEVLEADRILLTSSFEPSDRKAVLGKVSSVEKNEFSLKENGNDTEYIIEPGDDITVTILEDEDIVKSRFSNILEGDRIIVAGTSEGETIEARTIRIISRPEPSPTPEDETQ
jgi:hypothetical protein